MNEKEILVEYIDGHPQLSGEKLSLRYSQLSDQVVVIGLS